MGDNNLNHRPVAQRNEEKEEKEKQNGMPPPSISTSDEKFCLLSVSLLCLLSAPLLQALLLHYLPITREWRKITKTM